jgi:PIN domain nuclease of toxin-antitoxin system
VLARDHARAGVVGPPRERYRLASLKCAKEKTELMIVLDTQVWLWWVHDVSKLTKRASFAIKQAEETGGIRVSVISVWEIAVKSALGKLELSMEMDEWFRLAKSYPNLVVEPVSAQDVIASARLPGNFHKDPADRIIVAMSRRYGVSLVTSDGLIQAYPHVAVIW